jgi:hypothetical protein
VQGDRRECLRDGQAQRAGAAAQVDDGCLPVGFFDRQTYEERAANPGDEDAGAQVYAYAAEVGVAGDLFQGFAGGAAFDQGGQSLAVVAGGLGQDGRLLLGEDAAGRAEAGDGLSRCHGPSFSTDGSESAGCPQAVSAVHRGSAITGVNPYGPQVCESRRMRTTWWLDG